MILISSYTHALEFSKIEYEGCPENAYCKKETGITRKKWIEELKKFSAGKITEQQINALAQVERGIPITGWGREEASLYPNILMWDSPCKQHNTSTNKYYITEVFRKNLSSNDIKEFPNTFFSRAILNDNTGQPYSIVVPRSEAPLFMKDNALYYLQEEDGIFYGLLINRQGHFKITKNESNNMPSKEGICTKDQATLFSREAPSLNFYQETYCKDIWDKTTKSYKTIFYGRSCN